MPQIGWFELLLIIGLAVVIIGPKDFPIVLKKIGSWFGSIKRYISAVQSEVSNLEENTLDYENKENKDKVGSLAEVWKNDFFRSLIPIGIFNYGGMFAILTLWAGPWMTRVSGYTCLLYTSPSPRD